MGEGQRIFDLENEDNLEIAEQPFEDMNDYFIRAFHSESDAADSCSTFEMGLLEVEFSDSIIRKTIEVLFNGWPQPIQRSDGKIIPAAFTPKVPCKTTIKADLEGLVVRMRVKKDVSTLKILGLKINQTDDRDITTSLKFSLDDFQIMH